MGQNRPPRPASLGRFRRVSSDDPILEQARDEIRFLLQDKFMAAKKQEHSEDNAAA